MHETNMKWQLSLNSWGELDKTHWQQRRDSVFTDLLNDILWNVEHQ